MSRTNEEWVDYLKQLILAVDRELDVEFGPVNKGFVQPNAIAFAEQDAEITRLRDSMDIDNYNLMTDNEFISFLSNYLIEALVGSRSVGDVYFQTADFTTDITIPRSFPVSTEVGTYGQAVTFYTTQEKQMLIAQKSLYFNAAENLYEISVPTQCVSLGSVGKVPAGAVRVMLRNIPGISRVTNKVAFTAGGVDAETRAQSIRRLKGFIKSSGSLALKGGLVNSLLELVEDAVVVGAREPGFQRTSEESGAVDAYIIGTTEEQVSDFFRVGYYSTEDYTNNVVRVLDYQPTTELVSVVINAVDRTSWFELVKDVTSVHSGSVRAQDVLKVLPAHTGDLAGVIGDYGVVTYKRNLLIQTLQSDYDSDDKYVFGRDLLQRESVREDVYIEMVLTVLSGYDTISVGEAVRTAVYNYINDLQIAQSLERADVTFEAKKIAGVDNITYNNFRLLSEPSGTVHDIIPDSNQYLRAELSNILVS